MEEKKKRFKLTSSELRIIGISLAVLSLGLAIAYGGFIYFYKNKTSNPNPTNVSTPSGLIER